MLVVPGDFFLEVTRSLDSDPTTGLGSPCGEWPDPSAAPELLNTALVEFALKEISQRNGQHFADVLSYREASVALLSPVPLKILASLFNVVREDLARVSIHMWTNNNSKTDAIAPKSHSSGEG